MLQAKLEPETLRSASPQITGVNAYLLIMCKQNSCSLDWTLHTFTHLTEPYSAKKKWECSRGKMLSGLVRGRFVLLLPWEPEWRSWFSKADLSAVYLSSSGKELRRSAGWKADLCGFMRPTILCRDYRSGFSADSQLVYKRWTPAGCFTPPAHLHLIISQILHSLTICLW